MIVLIMSLISNRYFTEHKLKKQYTCFSLTDPSYTYLTLNYLKMYEPSELNCMFPKYMITSVIQPWHSFQMFFISISHPRNYIETGTNRVKVVCVMLKV